MGKLTDPRVFEAGWDEATEAPKDYRVLVAGAETRGDIVCRREPGIGALVNIEQRLIVHSPTGFEWGYGGSGPADLALNILAEFVAPPEAWRLHHQLKSAMIATMPAAGGIIRAADVVAWIRAFWAAEDRG